MESGSSKRASANLTSTYTNSLTLHAPSVLAHQRPWEGLRTRSAQTAGWHRAVWTENMLPESGEVNRKCRGNTQHLSRPGQGQVGQASLTDPMVHFAMMSSPRGQRLSLDRCSFQPSDSWESPTPCPSQVWGGETAMLQNPTQRKCQAASD